MVCGINANKFVGTHKLARHCCPLAVQHANALKAPLCSHCLISISFIVEPNATPYMAHALLGSLLYNYNTKAGEFRSQPGAIESLPDGLEIN